MRIITYLFFNGNCEEAMNFYRDSLGGTIHTLSRWGESRPDIAEEYKDKIMHATMNVGDDMMMFSDADDARKVTFGDNFSVSLDFKSDGEITRTFDAISAGGKVTMPLQDTFWGAKFGMCVDKFGINWMFNFDKPKDQ